MLDKKTAPTDADFIAHCGTCAGLFTALDEFLTGEGRAQKTLRFPYGNHYGWGYKYSVKNKHLCDIFAEKDAFTVMVRLSDAQFSEIYESLLDCGKEYVDHRYPCAWAAVLSAFWAGLYPAACPANYLAAPRKTALPTKKGTAVSRQRPSDYCN